MALGQSTAASPIHWGSIFLGALIRRSIKLQWHVHERKPSVNQASRIEQMEHSAAPERSADEST